MEYTWPAPPSKKVMRPSGAMDSMPTMEANAVGLALRRVTTIREVRGM